MHHSVVHADAAQFFRSFRCAFLSFVQEYYVLIWVFSYDAHPMAILTSAFAYLGSYYSEANPSLKGRSIAVSSNHAADPSDAGQTLFTKGTPESLAIMDKQIYRLIGKATTLAA